MATANAKPLFWRPGTARPSELPSLVDREPHREAAGIVYNPVADLTFAQQRRRLPIYDDRRALLYMIEKFATTVVVGHTGCGKTTQVPQYLHEAGWTKEGHTIACTQPRRVAATSVAERVAEEMGVTIGTTVGYAVRFDDCFDAGATRIKYMTDGRLIRELMGDPLLSQYSVIMVDEAHERSTTTDVLLGLLKKVRRKRPELRLVVASATLDADAFATFFEEHVGPDGSPVEQSAAILTLRGSGTHPVAWHFLEEAVPDYLAHSIEAVLRIHESGEAGDILLFLTGQHEVEAAVAQLNERAAEGAAGRKRRGHGGSGGGGGGGSSPRLIALPMYAGLASKAQYRAFEPSPSGTRKVVVATNIAETSITIDGIVHVVDCGFAKQRFAHPSGEEALVVAPISQSSARQRAGRAGRSQPGSYYSMMTEAAFHSLAAQTPPEMQRCSLASTVLQLKALGIDNVLRFEFLSPPPPQALSNALETLYALGAIDGTGALTFPRGEAMAMLPLEPQQAAFLLSAASEGCQSDALTLAALLSLQSPFVPLKPADLAVARGPFAVYEGDAVTAFNVHRGYQRVRARGGERKASAWCKKRLLDERVLVRANQIRRALVGGYFANAAQHEGGGYYRSVLRGSPLKLHSNSVLYAAPPEWILFHETTYSAATELILSATKVEERWLAELAPHFYTRQQPGAEHAPRPAGATTTMTMKDVLAGGGGGGGLLESRKRSIAQRDGDAAAAGGGTGAPAARGGAAVSFAAMLGESIFKEEGGAGGGMF